MHKFAKTRWVYRSESIEAVWSSFEAIRNSLAEVTEKDNNALARTKAASLRKKIAKFEFVFAMMFMRLIMRKTSILTVPADKFAKKSGRRISKWLEDNPETLTILHASYQKCMIEALDSLNTDVDYLSLAAECEIFVNFVNETEETCKTVHDAGKIAFENKEIFPNVYRCYKLLFTSLVSVADIKRSFSKMKIVKNYLRSMMKGERLEDLVVLSSEKDLTDTIDVNVVLKSWATRKNQKLKIWFTIEA
ncbi:zinc finger MYM-type 1-like [Paramuricea clavata]|uniref:Zinc finger MYM-type 1-like n=1 Tax=Paramuricea clavata TaxID=317549 RepID=A0A7D9I1D5_PARCT|nr:zinc finger MYM-type 1-like [Paramuricea clavata]